MTADPDRRRPEGRTGRSRVDPAASGDPDRASDERRDVGDAFDELEELEEMVDDPEEREQVREAMRAVADAEESPVFGRIIWGFDRADAAEALLGSLLFGIPMAVEGGTNEVGAFVASNPLYLLGTVGAAVGIVVGILYVAEIQDVRVSRRLFGLVPMRLAGVLTISGTVAVGMLTLWGRVDWGDPWLAVCTCSVAFVPMAIGAALGDILPGS